jgi:hypothetical protein
MKNSDLQKMLHDEVRFTLGSVKKPNHLWYIKEVSKNNITCRSRENGSIFFIFTNRGNLKLNPDFVSLFPERIYMTLEDDFVDRFPELKIRFSHKPPTIMLMNPSDICKSNYSKH